jgi:uncharacterized protein (DUF362 family)
MTAEAFKLSESPFMTPGDPKVFVAGGKGPYDNTMDALSHVDLSPAKGKRVLLKPNVGRLAASDSGVITNPEVVAAAIDAFRAVGAEVHVGESPITGVKTMEAFEESGIAAVCRERDCPLIDMDARPFVKTALPEGQAIQELKMCPELLEFDLVVSIPVMKMHMHTGVTLAIKNMKGCLWRRSKVHLHMLPPQPGTDVKPINIAIADMSWALRPHLSICDGTVGMEGLGPSAGAPKRMGAVVVAADAFAADAVCCQLMGTSAATIPHLAIGAERGYGVIDLDRIDVEPKDWRDSVTPFEPPPAKIDINFPNVTILDENSCSACQSTLMLFLKRYGDEVLDYLPKGRELLMAIGKGHTELADGTICIGNCTMKHKDAGTFIKGCPPVGSAILSAITGKESVDVEDGHSKN